MTHLARAIIVTGLLALSFTAVLAQEAAQQPVATQEVQPPPVEQQVAHGDQQESGHG